jgi:plasmid rolling circle replication initiator protein Rep
MNGWKAEEKLDIQPGVKRLVYMTKNRRKNKNNLINSKILL